ncbi:dihydrodipicolinate reductase [Micrococcales bacterium KH10]|nr:dihydrodipicolinate reductase [Micrococcales bacterium KH10]
MHGVNNAESPVSESVIRVAVIGAAGRMGRTVCEAVTSAPDMELAAQIDMGDDLATVLQSANVDVAVDFSIPTATEANVHTLIDHGVHAVVGATGWDEDSLGRVETHLADKSNTTGVLVAPNFSLSAVFAMTFAAQAAAFFESVEVIELHHPDKVDAPSGTARHTATKVAEARAAAGVGASPDATEVGHEARGAVVDGVHVHAVRLRGLVAHEEILLGNPGEQLVIRQDSFERTSFMPGVLLGVRQTPSRPGLTVGLEHLLGLAK